MKRFIVFLYLDPGIGSLLIQMVLGGIAAILVAFKVSWRCVVDFFSGRKKSISKDISRER